MKTLCWNCKIYFDSSRGHFCEIPQQFLDSQPSTSLPPLPYSLYFKPVPEIPPFWDDVMPCGCKWNSLTGESRICRLHWQEFKKNES